MERHVDVLSVFGARLHVEQVGDLGARPLILLHGGPGADARYLQPQCDALADLTHAGRPLRLVYYDQRGAERSPLDPKASPGGVATHVADLDRVRQFLRQDTCWLAGYSWGALLALLYALEYPDRVERLLLISPAPAHAAGRAMMQENMRRAAEVPERRAVRDQWLGQSDALDDQARRRYQFAWAVQSYFADPVDALRLTPFRVMQRVEQAIWTSLGDYDIRKQLPMIRHIPSLLVHGEQDVIPVAGAAEMADKMGAAFVPISRCGHVPFVEQPNALWSAVQRWFDQT